MSIEHNGKLVSNTQASANQTWVKANSKFQLNIKFKITVKANKEFIILTTCSIEAKLLWVWAFRNYKPYNSLFIDSLKIWSDSHSIFRGLKLIGESNRVKLIIHNTRMKILCSLWLPGVTHGHHKILCCLPWDALSGFYLQPLVVFACFCIQLCLQWIKCILSWGQLRTWPFENILLGCFLNDVWGHYLSVLSSSVSLHFAAFDFIHCFHIIASFCRAGQVFPVQIWPFTFSALTDV